jgi:succinyldiaminopimelate transaminase
VSAPLPANPRLAEEVEYPFERFAAVRAAGRARGQEPIDLSLGDPREPTPAFIREALARAIPERSSYPSVAGRPELRRAAAGWVERRFGVRLDPDRHVLPANGSKEAIAHLALAVVDAEGPRRRVVIPVPAYPVYARAARLAGGLPTPLPLAEARGYLPDLDAVPAAVWRETALLWLNYPHNPTGAVAPLALYERALALAREHGFVVASDEAYCEIYFDRPPPSLLQAGLEHGLAIHTLSKRSAMTGYRSGFMAGDPALIAAYRALRPTLGVATPDFVQAAAIAAWGEDAHAGDLRRAFAARRELFLELLAEKGLAAYPSSATFFLWVAAPGGDDGACAERWFAAGVLPMPGSWLTEGGAGHLRLALVPTLEDCREAVRRLRAAL